MTTESAAAPVGATVYGYPRQGQNRELKKAVEGYWKGRVTAEALRATARDLRRTNWARLAEAGITEVPTGDFSYYDHVLDTTVMVGAIPDRHRSAVAADALDGYFAMARGTQDVAPLEMTKWFDTNYHYLVPELGPDTVFTAEPARQVAELKEALALGHRARPVLVGPVTYLLLAKPAPGTPPASIRWPSSTGCSPSTHGSSPNCALPAPPGSSSTNRPWSRTAPRPN